MPLGFDVVADENRVDTVVVGASDRVAVEDDDLDGADANNVNAIDDVSGVDDCESNDVETTDAVTDEDGAAVVDKGGDDTGVDCNRGVPVYMWVKNLSVKIK